jgi:hypothetical protein
MKIKNRRKSEMETFLKNVDSDDVNELFTGQRKLKALLDLKSTLKVARQLADIPDDLALSWSPISLEEINAEIRHLQHKRTRKLDEIRVKNGWSEELMSQVTILEDSRAFLKDRQGGTKEHSR